jgi:hypothetical protein
MRSNLSATNTRSERETKDALFTGWFVPLSQNAKTLVQRAIAEAEAYETEHAPRRKKRRAKDRETFQGTISAVLSELIRMVLRGDERGLAIPRSKIVLGVKSVYRPPALNDKLPDVLNLLVATGWIGQQLGQRAIVGKGQRTLLYPSDSLSLAIAEHGLTLCDIGRNPAEQVVILKGVKEDYWHKGERMEYPDTDDVIRIRQDVQAINQHLAEADIELNETLILVTNKTYDPEDRTLRRFFSRGSFQSGGRLFGGYWQPLNSEDRLRAISINGEDVVCLDYGQMILRTLYAMAGETPTKTELYELDKFGVYDPKTYRSGIKQFVGAMLFADKPITRKPKDMTRLLPKGLSAEQIASSIIDTHPKVARYFYTGVGYDLQFLESEVIIAILLKLMDENIVALPIHDAVVVPCSEEDETRAVMLEVFKEKVGGEITVSREVAATPNPYKRLSQRVVAGGSLEEW